MGCPICREAHRLQIWPALTEMALMWMLRREVVGDVTAMMTTMKRSSFVTSVRTQAPYQLRRDPAGPLRLTSG